MADLVYIEESFVAGKVLPVLSVCSDVVGAFHFGSSLGLCRPDSDIDIGLVFRPKMLTSVQELETIIDSIQDDLPPIDGHPFDIIALNCLTSILAFRIVKSGRLIFMREQGIVSDFIERVSREYGENYPRYRAALQTILGV